MRSIDGALILVLSVLALASCRTAPVSVPACDNDALTSHPALLVLAPHPDDETLGFAGLIDAYVQQGKPVKVVVVTDGDAYCEACRLWKSTSLEGPMCNAEDLAMFGEVRRSESIAATRILGLSSPAFLGYPDAALGAAWRNFGEGNPAKPLRRTDFAPYASCADAVYGGGAHTSLSAQTLMETLREHIAASPPGALLATTHRLDGHGDHAALGSFVARLSDDHPVAYAVIHAHTPKATAHPDCWYPPPAAAVCPCFDEQRAFADPGLIHRQVAHRLRPALPAALPDDTEYGVARQLCLPDRLYRGEEAAKLRAVRSYASQLGRVARNGTLPPAVEGIMNCNGYVTAFVRSTEVFVVVPPAAQRAGGP